MSFSARRDFCEARAFLDILKMHVRAHELCVRSSKKNLFHNARWEAKMGGAVCLQLCKMQDCQDEMLLLVFDST